MVLQNFKDVILKTAENVYDTTARIKRKNQNGQMIQLKKL